MLNSMVVDSIDTISVDPIDRPLNGSFVHSAATASKEFLLRIISVHF